MESERVLKLHYWYIDERAYEEFGGKTCRLLHGNVSGHERLADTNFIHTSKVEAVELDEANGELLVHTKNSLYHCPLAYCNTAKQDEFPALVPEYAKIKAEYAEKREDPTIEAGKVLAVFSNFDQYYFHSLCHIPADGEKAVDYTAKAHFGMYSDSFLIAARAGDKADIDLRYYPRYQNMEFYSEECGGAPLFIENIGDIALYFKFNCGIIVLEPGERKEVKPENCTDEDIFLPGWDLYPTPIIEE